MHILMNHWGVLKERLKQKYAGLSDNDLAYVKGCEEETLHRIAEKSGATRAEIDQHVREACATALTPAPADTTAVAA